MKTLSRVCASTALALIVSATCFAQLRIAIWPSASASRIVAYPHASFTVSGSVGGAKALKQLEQETK
jgi:hypothetical protein